SLLFASYYDPQTKGQKATGQKLKIKNSAPLLHNTKLEGNTLVNPAINETIPGGQERIVDKLRPDRQPISLACNVHNWMRGWLWAGDPPYAAVTKGDRPKDEKDYGAYEIAKIPAGVSVEVWVWHEANPSFTIGGNTVAGTARGVKVADMTLKDGENTLDIKV